MNIDFLRRPNNFHKEGCIPISLLYRKRRDIQSVQYDSFTNLAECQRLSIRLSIDICNLSSLTFRF